MNLPMKHLNIEILQFILWEDKACCRSSQCNLSLHEGLHVP